MYRSDEEEEWLPDGPPMPTKKRAKKCTPTKEVAAGVVSEIAAALAPQMRDVATSPEVVAARALTQILIEKKTVKRRCKCGDSEALWAVLSRWGELGERFHRERYPAFKTGRDIKAAMDEGGIWPALTGSCAEDASSIVVAVQGHNAGPCGLRAALRHYAGTMGMGTLEFDDSVSLSSLGSTHKRVFCVSTDNLAELVPADTVVPFSRSIYSIFGAGLPDAAACIDLAIADEKETGVILRQNGKFFLITSTTCTVAECPFALIRESRAQPASEVRDVVPVVELRDDNAATEAPSVPLVLPSVPCVAVRRPRDGDARLWVQSVEASEGECIGRMAGNATRAVPRRTMLRHFMIAMRTCGAVFVMESCKCGSRSSEGLQCCKSCGRFICAECGVADLQLCKTCVTPADTP